MSKSKELSNTTALVKTILDAKPQTRNSDDLLYYEVCVKSNSDCSYLPFWKVMQNRKAYRIPPFESVRRARQKLQATYPELASDSDVEAQRELNEEVFRDYARGTV
jgi:hypothetical protein